VIGNIHRRHNVDVGRLEKWQQSRHSILDERPLTQNVNELFRLMFGASWPEPQTEATCQNDGNNFHLTSFLVSANLPTRIFELHLNSESRMIRHLIAVMILSFAVVSASAQDDRLDELSFDEGVPLKDEDVPYFAVGVGPVATFNFAPLDDVNAMATSLQLDNLNGPVFQAGAEFFAAIGFVKNLRVGFSWVSGNVQSTKDFAAVNEVPAFKRTLEYSLGSRTVHIDYGIQPLKGLAILPGVGFGWGSQTIQVYQAPANLDYTVPFPVSSVSGFSDLRRNVIYVQPRLNIEYNLSAWLCVRGQAAYTLEVGKGDWLANRTAVVSNVPTNISMSSLNAQIGLFIGLFN